MESVVECREAEQFSVPDDAVETVPDQQMEDHFTAR